MMVFVLLVWIICVAGHFVIWTIQWPAARGQRSLHALRFLHESA
jgi:uncharacterized membrane protein